MAIPPEVGEKQGNLRPNDPRLSLIGVGRRLNSSAAVFRELGMVHACRGPASRVRAVGLFWWDRGTGMDELIALPDERFNLKRALSGVFWVMALAISSFFGISYSQDSWPFGDHRTVRERYSVTKVERVDLAPIVNVPGRVESIRKTIVRCELQNLAGQTAGGSSTLIELLPEGSAVKKGDVLGRLDGSNFEEMLRQQAIVVEQARASELQARLTYEIAVLSVKEYEEGTVLETLKGMEGTVALARSDLSRAKDHMEWSQRMNGKGYASLAQVINDANSTQQLDFSLKRQLSTVSLFQRFTRPKTKKTLLGEVKMAEMLLNNETLRLSRQLDRQKMIQGMVDHCVIRAPHDGYLYYVKEGRQPVQIEEGLVVRQGQGLFYLPDLTRLQVIAAFNESVVDRVSVGLPARVYFEAYPQLCLPGTVTTVNQIPVPQNDRGEDVRFFVGNVRLDATSPQLRPGMSSRVDIQLGNRKNVIAVPHRALISDHGRIFCYVYHDEQLEQRDVRTGSDTPELIEVVQGLEPGEEIALNPPETFVRPRPLLGFDQSDRAPRSDRSPRKTANRQP